MSKLSFAALLAFSTLGLSAHADRIFNVSNATFSTSPSGGTAAGTLNGTFTTNDAISAVVAFNLTASASGAFAGFQYTPATASTSGASLPSQYFRIDSPGSINELQLYFANGLTASGGTLLAANSYEHEPSGGNRFLSGTVTAAATTAVTPEPSSIVLLGTGLLGMAAAVKRRFV